MLCRSHGSLTDVRDHQPHDKQGMPGHLIYAGPHSIWRSYMRIERVAFSPPEKERGRMFSIMDRRRRSPTSSIAADRQTIDHGTSQRGVRGRVVSRFFRIMAAPRCFSLLHAEHGMPGLRTCTSRDSGKRELCRPYFCAERHLPRCRTADNAQKWLRSAAKDQPLPIQPREYRCAELPNVSCGCQMSSRAEQPASCKMRGAKPRCRLFLRPPDFHFCGTTGRLCAKMARSRPPDS